MGSGSFASQLLGKVSEKSASWSPPLSTEESRVGLGIYIPNKGPLGLLHTCRAKSHPPGDCFPSCSTQAAIYRRWGVPKCGEPEFCFPLLNEASPYPLRPAPSLPGVGWSRKFWGRQGSRASWVLDTAAVSKSLEEGGLYRPMLIRWLLALSGYSCVRPCSTRPQGPRWSAQAWCRQAAAGGWGVGSARET